MAYTCQYCATLSITRLVELAKEDFSSRRFSSKKFFEHHKSFHDLDASAQNGCGLCRLIVNCFKGSPRNLYSHQPYTWEGPNCPQNSSTYGQIKESSEDTDIKLCLNTQTLGSSEPLKEVGIVEEQGEDEMVRPSNFEFLQLALSTAADKPRVIDGFRIGNLRVEEDLSSTANFSIAKAWLHDCRASHNTCQLKHLPQLPTRVIDVGSDEDDIPRIVLSQGAEADNVALSHCWGGKIPVLLTSETIADFQNALPLPELSQNFRDAIRITQEVGIRFLWIDSLCILQDSKLDWQSESREMGRIYRDSTLTIYAAVAECSTAGILCQRTMQYKHLPAPAYIPLRSRPNDPEQQQQKQQEVVGVSWLPPKEEDLAEIYRSSPLYSRGWCLQESILAPRQLIYGARQIYWRCQAGSQSADGTPSGWRYPQDNYENFTSLILSNILAAPSPFHGTQPLEAEIVASVLQDYYSLIQTYCVQKLTYGSDKFPAFSGLARLVQPILPAEAVYLAGLWSTDMHQGLLWHCDTNGCEHVAKVPFRAPSWSWAVTDSQVHFSQPTWPLQHDSLSMKLLDSHVVLQDPENPFGELVSAAIRVQVHVMNLVRSPEVARIKLDEAIGQAWFDQKDERAEDGILSLTPSLFVAYAEGRDDFILAIWTERGEDTEFVVDTTLFPPGLLGDMLFMLVRLEYDENDAGSGYIAEGLILQRVEETMLSNAYERVGMARLVDLNIDWLKSWDSKVLELV